MSLEKWVEYGWLRREPTSPGEIKDLLGIVDRSLADAKVEAVSTDLRFIAAFNAALCIATTALRASRLRTVTQAGHHVKQSNLSNSPKSQPDGHSKIQDLQQLRGTNRFMALPVPCQIRCWHPELRAFRSSIGRSPMLHLAITQHFTSG
jgi:hypothetical protein